MILQARLSLARRNLAWLSATSCKTPDVLHCICEVYLACIIDYYQYHFKTSESQTIGVMMHKPTVETSKHLDRKCSTGIAILLCRLSTEKKKLLLSKCEND